MLRLWGTLKFKLYQRIIVEKITMEIAIINQNTKYTNKPDYLNCMGSPRFMNLLYTYYFQGNYLSSGKF